LINFNQRFRPFTVLLYALSFKLLAFSKKPLPNPNTHINPNLLIFVLAKIVKKEKQ